MKIATLAVTDTQHFGGNKTENSTSINWHEPHPSAIISPRVLFQTPSQRYMNTISKTPLRITKNEALVQVKKFTTERPWNFQEKCMLYAQESKLREVALLKTFY